MTANQEAAANRLFDAQRTGDAAAIQRANAYQRYYQRQAQVNAYLQHEAALANNPRVEAERQHNEIGNAYHNAR